MKKKQKDTIVVVSLIVLLCGVLASVFLSINKSAEKMAAAQIAISVDPDFDLQDSLLFDAGELKNITPFCYLSSATRPVQKGFRYKDVGEIFYTTIEVGNDKPLKDILFVRNEEYKGFRRDVAPSFSYFGIAISEDGAGKADSIICSYTGHTELMHRVDYSKDFVSYYIPLLRFNIRYGENLPSDMFVKTPYSHFLSQVPMPFTFAFYKKGTDIFLIVYRLVPEKEKYGLKYFDEISPDFLGSIIDWRDGDSIAK